MKNLAIINGINMTPLALEPLEGGDSALSRVVKYAHSLEGVEKVVLFSLPTAPVEGVEVIERAEWNTRLLLEEMGRAARGFDNIIYCPGDAPFLDPGVTGDMLISHNNYFAEYTFADGYPGGIVPEVFKPEILGRLIKLLGETAPPVNRDTVFEIIKKDINAFDVETEISPRDLRFLRLGLYCDTPRNREIILAFLREGASGRGEIFRICEEKPQILRSLPAYFPIQITRGCPQSCSYCPYPGLSRGLLEDKEIMPLENLTLILDKIEAFAGDGHICFSPWGDPALHPAVFDMMEEVLRRPALSLVMETAGIGWDLEQIRGLAEKYPENLPLWILSLDAWERKTYQSLRGQGYLEAREFAEKMIELFPDTVYIQAVRMKSNEDDLEHFYDNWKQKTEKIIIQKYDHFAGILEDKRVTDLSPVDRFPCWHIKRDMLILINGRVPLCREDLGGEYLLGNILKEDISQIWEKGMAHYQAHLEEKYNRMCENCDEYYTYNF